ncbi:MAG: ABC transporter ATP-binding protein [Oligoflexia bacterium]|nr:ABC transporter ATP-binding protein [Oligoflexia bacterium]
MYDPKENRKDPLQTLLSHFKNKRSQMINAGTFSVLNKIFDIAPPILIGLAVDTVVKGEESFIANLGVSDKLYQIYILAFFTFLVWGLESLFEFLFKIKWRNIAQDVQHDLRIEVYEHMQSLHISFFEDQNTGNLTTIMNDDINQLERFLDVGANDIIQVLTTVVTIGGIFFYISPMIACFSFLPVPFILLGSFYFQKRIAPRYLGVREEAGLLASMLVNNLNGMMTIKSYVAQLFEKKRLEKQSLEYSSSNKKAIVLSSSFSPLIRMVVLCGFLFSLVLGAMQVFDGVLEVGSYSVLIFMVQRLLWPLTRLGETFDQYQRSMASTQRIFNLLETKVEINDGDKEVDENIKGELQLKDVSFKYATGSEVLKNINLNVPQGKTVALVGTTGSGKSTILKLLLRFYDVTQGEILLDGQNVKELKQNSFRSIVGFVSQDTYLFHGTVEENIRYGSFDKTLEDVKEAAQLAEAHDFISSLPEKYQTIVGERGQKLSGGQRQRICIARAILKNPKIFVFDEATSAVDNETEAAIQRSLNKITKDRTTIMVAHRLSTIKHADCIYVLEQGEIVESGSHEELISQNGIYHALWNVQTGAR